MKKTSKIIVSVLLLATMIFTIAACGGLSGTYTATDGSGSLTFNGDQITMSVANLLDLKGTYTINGDKIKIRFEVAGQSTEQEYSFKQEGNSVFLEGQEFKK